MSSKGQGLAAAPQYPGAQVMVEGETLLVLFLRVRAATAFAFSVAARLGAGRRGLRNESMRHVRSSFPGQRTD